MLLIVQTAWKDTQGDSKASGLKPRTPAKNLGIMKFECIFASEERQTSITYDIRMDFLYPFGSVVDASILPSVSLCGLSYCRRNSWSLATSGEQTASLLYITQISFTMPNSNEVCARANNSTPVATLFHETESLVSVHDGQAVTTSLQVAEVFQKNHKEVLRTIRELDCSRDLQERNFAPSSYVVDLPNGGRKKNPMYYIGRDGFVFLVMGFTGKIAAKFKEAYIRQFNEMEEMLRKSKETQYASRLLDAQVERFSRDLKAIVRRRRMDGRRFYGPAGELRTGFFYDRSADFETKLDTVFSQMKNACLDGFSFVESMEENRRRLDAVDGAVREFMEKMLDRPL